MENFEKDVHRKKESAKLPSRHKVSMLENDATDLHK